MVHEYALEPELVATWGDLNNYRMFNDKFGIGTSRIVSEYPKNWARIAYDACKTTDDIEKTRLIDIIYQLREKMIVRQDIIYNDNLSWLECAELEHKRLPFKAIIASTNPRKSREIILGDEVGVDINDFRWKTEEFPTRREAKAMAITVEPMLSNCREVFFIDPYFTPANPKKTKPLQEFFKAIMANRKTVITRLELVTKYDDKDDNDSFTKRCLNILPNYLPYGLMLTVLRIAERKGKEQIHNRYVLTDIGLINFGVGLDEGKQGQTDDVGLRSRPNYEMRWRQYSKITEQRYSDHREFDLVGDPIIIEGKAI